MNNKSIHSGHRQRLIKQIETTYPANLSDLHFLEYLLTFSIPRADTNPIAHNLLAEFKTIDAIFDASETALKTVKGVGPATARFLKFMSTVSYMYRKSLSSRHIQINTILEAIHYIYSVLPPSTNEQFIVLILNKSSEVKNYKIFEGVSHSFINFDAKELSSFLINHKASFCILAHTHPHCSATPSIDDRHTFNRLTPLFESLAIKILDNIIIGEKDYFSANLNNTYEMSFDINIKSLKPIYFKDGTAYPTKR